MAFIHQMTTSQRRAAAANGDIDETLFATKKNTKRGINSTATVISTEMLKKLSLDTGNSNIVHANPHDAVVINTSDLAQIKETSAILSSADAATRKRFTESSRAALAEKAKLRKEKMLKMEKERKAIAPKTEEEIEDEKHRDSLLGHAKSKMDEEHDDVKHMNQMALYAKCVTIRDAQILEKQRIAESLIEEEKRLDMAMEVERIKAMKAFEEREAVRQAEQKIGAQIIIKQIQEREQERIRQQETREQEAHSMIQRVRELEMKEEEERLDKIARGRKLLGQVMEANDAQARAKLRKKQEEIDEDARIAEYIRQKEERERHQEAELERIRADKEYEITRLRNMQEKAQDRQSAIDELRAKRYQETKDRQWRQQQLEAASKKDTMKRDISNARENQRQEKARRIAEQALQEREEYLRVLEWQQTQNVTDQRKHETAAEQAKRHRSELQKQIQTREREKEEARTLYLEEGKLIQQQLEAEKKKLLKLKQQKLNELAGAGVPEKYRSELAKKKVCVSSIHV